MRGTPTPAVSLSLVSVIARNEPWSPIPCPGGFFRIPTLPPASSTRLRHQGRFGPNAGVLMLGDPASLPKQRLQLQRGGGIVLEFVSVRVRVKFLQSFGQFEINLVQAHLPLLDLASHQSAGFALLPSLGFRIEFLPHGRGDAVASARAKSSVSL